MVGTNMLLRCLGVCIVAAVAVYAQNAGPAIDAILPVDTAAGGDADTR